MLIYNQTRNRSSMFGARRIDRFYHFYLQKSAQQKKIADHEEKCALAEYEKTQAAEEEEKFSDVFVKFNELKAKTNVVLESDTHQDGIAAEDVEMEDAEVLTTFLWIFFWYQKMKILFPKEKVACTELKIDRLDLEVLGEGILIYGPRRRKRTEYEESTTTSGSRCR